MRPSLLAALGAGLVLATAALVAPERFWTAYVAAALFGFSVAAGTVAFASALEITRAGWAERLMPLLDSWLRPLYAASALLLLVAVGASRVYPWAPSPPPGFEGWLTPGVVLVRDAVALLVLAAVARWMIRGRDGHRRRAAVTYALVYAAVGTLLSWDLAMSLEPGWVSTLFGAHFFVGGLYAGIAVVAVLSGRGRAGVNADVAHDLGKLLFGGAMVWGYFLWSQYLVIWYGNLPREAGFWLRRTEAGWGTLGLAVMLLAGVVPFVALLPRAVKRVPHRLAAVAGLVLLGLWGEKVLLLGPAARPFPALPVGLPELSVAAGVIAILLAARPREAVEAGARADR